MPNITVYIKNAVWTQILKVHNGDDIAARHWVKALVEGHYVKKEVPAERKALRTRVRDN